MSAERIDFRALCAEFSLTGMAERAGVKLKRAGREYTGCCPFHSEKTPSFTIYDGGDRERFKCFGCGVEGDVIKFVELFNGVDTKEAIKILKGVGPALQPSLPRPMQRNDEEGQIERARKLYKSGQPAEGTAVEKYLRGRGIDLDKIGGIPPSLRFGMVDYWCGQKNSDRPLRLGTFPAMLAPIQKADGSVTGVHITYIDPITFLKLQPIDPENPKKFLPAKKIRGVKNGGCIRLGPGGPRLVMSEGIETALSIRMATIGTANDVPVWTCIDLDNFSILRLPMYVTDLLFGADNDMNIPRHGSKDRNTRAVITQAARRLRGMGCRVRIAWANGGADFNDMLTRSATGGT